MSSFYENTCREFETAWEHLKTGGLLFSHNIDYSDAFADFMRDHNVEGIIMGDTGEDIALWRRIVI